MWDHHHRNVQGGGARAAVFGVADGLVTNVSLILGIAGADAGPSVVRLAGIALLIAGAFSMASGEWTSMSAQRELLERELAMESTRSGTGPRGSGASSSASTRSVVSTPPWPAPSPAR